MLFFGLTLPPWAALGVILLLTYLWPWVRLLWMAYQLPRPPALPILGHLLLLRKSKGVSRLAIDLHRDPKPLVCIWVSLLPAVVLLSPEYVQTLMSDSRETEKSFVYKILKPFFGEGLITDSGDKWRRNRKVINPAFHVTVLGGFVSVFVANSIKMAAKMAAVARSGEEFCAADFSFPCALDIICETALGARVGAQDGTCKEFNAVLREAVGILMRRAVHPWLLIEWIFKLTPDYRTLQHHRRVLMKLSSKVVNERRDYRKNLPFRVIENEGNPPDNLTDPRRSSLFLDLLLDMQESDTSQMTEEELFNEVNTFMIAGHETSALVFSFCLLMIALHSDVQERVYEELESIFMVKPLENMDLNDLRDMKFLERCILETLRLYPTVPAIARTLSRDFQMGTYTLPAGCQVVIPIVLLQRDPDTYADPHSFKPDRFEQERHPFSYIPFSAGPRGCIGQKFALLELKAMLSTVLWQYWVHPVTTMDEVKLRWKLTLNTEKPLMFRLEDRRKAH